MWRRSRSDRRRRTRGFSLAEALVSLIMIVIIMSVTMSLLFSMKSFAERQQVFMAPRQQARRAMEYLKFYVAGAGDANDRAGNFSNPTALITQYGYGTQASPGTPLTASYNNLTATQATSGFGTEGTDIVSLAVPTNPMKIEVVDFPGHPTNTDRKLYLNFRAGCGTGDVQNMAEFKKYSGAYGTAGSEKSGLLTIVNANGNWEYLQIASYDASNCAATDDHVITITYKAPTVAQYTKAGGFVGLNTGGKGIYVIAGMQWISFRLRNNALEQKIDYTDSTGNYKPGWFDPAVDGDPANSRFTRILDNIEDFQVSYVFPYATVAGNSNSFIANGSPATSLSSGTNSGTPAMSEGACVAGNVTANCVVGLRISLVARTGPLRLEALQQMERGLLRRPASEDRLQATAADTDGTGYFQRYRMTSTMIIRNRLLGY